MKISKARKKDKKTGEKSGKKSKRGPKKVILPEMGPKIDFSQKNCQEKS